MLYIRQSCQGFHLVNTNRDSLRISDITLHSMDLRREGGTFTPVQFLRLTFMNGNTAAAINVPLTAPLVTLHSDLGVSWI